MMVLMIVWGEAAFFGSVCSATGGRAAGGLSPASEGVFGLDAGAQLAGS